MKKITEISASFTGTISTGSYENSKPYFSVKEICETEKELGDDFIELRQKQLHEMCYRQFQQHAELANSERIAREYQGIRLYDGENGRKYPSVTSIIGWDKDFYMKDDELAQHAARGTIIDKQVEIFLNTEEWKEAKDIRGRL